MDTPKDAVLTLRHIQDDTESSTVNHNLKQEQLLLVLLEDLFPAVNKRDYYGVIQSTVLCNEYQNHLS